MFGGQEEAAQEHIGDAGVPGFFIWPELEKYARFNRCPADLKFHRALLLRSTRSSVLYAIFQ